MPTPVLSIDFETASLADLRRTGVHTYAEHPSTRVICMSYAFGDDPVCRWKIGDPFPQEVLTHVMLGRTVQAWNAGFEWNIWNKTLTRQLGLDPDLNELSLSQVSDTMARAAFYGLPLSLDQAGPAAGLAFSKDKEGHALMMRMCKPRKHDPETGVTTWWHEDEPDRLERLMDYCDRDVEVERAIGRMIPALPERERQTWELDQRINARGVGVDYTFVERLQHLAEEAAERGKAEIVRLTNGQVTSVNAHKAFLEHVQQYGYPHDNLRKETLTERLDEADCDGMERVLLELRADVARTSAAKLKSMLDACPVRDDIGQVRGMLQYYGANRTGRWAGRLIQLQNMPRGDFKDVDGAVDAVNKGLSYDALEWFFGPAMGIVSTLLRSCIVARKGKKLAVADFSQIEARVIAWLAGQNDILEVFASGADVYRYTIGRVMGIDWQSIPKDSPLRQRGKIMVLGLGFGMGSSKFQDTARKSVPPVILSEEEASDAVKGWRQANDKIVSFWWELDRAVRTVLQHPSQTVDVNGLIRVGMWGNHLVLRLPSERPLVYRDAKLVVEPDGKTSITYMGINQYTRKWERIRTYGGKLAENVTQATARDIMRDAMLEAESRGIECILTVHDELLTEPDAAKADDTLKTLLDIMNTPPAWAAGLPVGGEGWVGERYKK